MKNLGIILIFLLISGYNLTEATIIHIPADYSTIQAGINAAVEGDTVLVANGVYIGTGNKDIDFSGKAIVVMSENGAENCIIDCEGSGRGFNFHSGENSTSVLKGFKITNGNLTGGRGAGIYCSSSAPTIQDCIITGNTADDCGGGIDCTNSSYAIISNCTITENVATVDGGGILCELYSYVTFINCNISDNSAMSGGGIFITDYANPVFTNCLFSGNSATYDGGAVYCHAGAVPSFTDCQFEGNSAGWSGAGIIVLNTSFSIENSEISYNEAMFYGGGIHTQYSSAQITDCTICGDTAWAQGGGIWSRTSDIAISGCAISDNIAQGEGGGIFSVGTSTFNITNTIISGNCGGQGGGIWNQDNSALNINNCAITDNSTSAMSGGGILSLNYSPLTISNSAISNNSCLYAGAGLHCVSNSTLTADHCEINGNTAVFQGGGIYNESYYGPYLSYCTIAGNSSDTDGAGVYSVSTLPEITNCTFYSNLTPTGGGALRLDYCSNIILKNNIFFANGHYGTYFVNPFFTAFDYSDFGANGYGDYYFEPGGSQAPPGLGIIDTTNANGDPCDVYMNIYLDPEFVDPGAGNLFLQSYSPCIDAGDPNSPLDPDSTIADMGAHWYGESVVRNPGPSSIPDNFALHSAYPNPFNPETHLRYDLCSPGLVTLIIYDLQGREVKKLVEGMASAGSYDVVFNGNGLASGIYFAVLRSGDLCQTQKLLLIK